MPQRWTGQKFGQIALVAIGLLLIIFLPRVTNLDRFLTADEKRWQSNTAGFVTKLAHGKLDQLVQQPHPGITTQWLVAPTIFSDSWTIQKLPLVIAQSILVLMISYVFWRLWGPWAGLGVALVLGLSPPLIAHTRVLAMDSLLALFSTLSLGLLLLWQQKRESHYLVLAAACAAAAWLSKLPGITLAPFSLAVLAFWHLVPQPAWRPLFKVSLIWVVSFIAAAVLILPSLALVPSSVIGDFMELFRSDDYQSLHPASSLYYFGTVLFSSTPITVIGLFAALYVLFFGRFNTHRRQQLAILLLFAVLFVIQMSVGAKKGDRYILPSLLLFDVVAISVLIGLIRSWWNIGKHSIAKSALVVVLLGVIWQGVLVAGLHPYTLAYVNPLFKPWLGERRLGWGEGLDLAADYINAKENAASLKVASFYPVEFSYNFVGETVPIHQWDTGSPDYVVAYRAMFERGDDAWETDVLQQLRERQPEKVFQFGGVDFIWIYRMSPEN